MLSFPGILMNSTCRCHRLADRHHPAFILTNYHQSPILKPFICLSAACTSYRIHFTIYTLHNRAYYLKWVSMRRWEVPSFSSSCTNELQESFSKLTCNLAGVDGFVAVQVSFLYVCVLQLQSFDVGVVTGIGEPRSAVKKRKRSL